MSGLHEYTDEFFEYIERGSIASAKRFSTFLAPLLDVNSVLDVGCGRGAWLREWRNVGLMVSPARGSTYSRMKRLWQPGAPTSA